MVSKSLQSRTRLSLSRARLSLSRAREQAVRPAAFSRPLTVSDRSLTVSDRSLTVSDRSLTVSDRSLTVSDRSLTVSDRSLTVSDRSLTVSDRSLTVSDRSLTVAALTGSILAGLLLLLLAGCARVGPPQPPFKRVPPPPEKLEAWQEGDVIRVRCVLPAENLDGSPIHDIRVVEIYGGIVPEGVHPLDTVGWGGVIETEEGDRLKALLKGKEFAVEIGREKLGDFETGRAGFSVRFANERNHWSVNTPVLILPVARVGGSPGALSARVEKTGVVLEWKPPAGTVPRDGYVVRRRELPGGAAADVGTVGPDATDFRDADLRFETRYAYSVAPFRNTGGGRVLGAFTPPTDVDTKDTFPPDVPTGLSLVEEEGRLRLIWNPVADADLAGYLVYRAGGDSSGETCLTPKPLAAASFTDTDADPARRWAYRVVAVDRKGNRSTPSETAQWEGRPEDR